MNEQASRHLQRETAFLSGCDANLAAAKGKLLRGTLWQRTAHDEVDRVKVLMAQNRLFDRELLKSLPANRRVVLHGYERALFFWKRRTGVAIASTLSPVAHDVASGGGEAPPISLGELTDHVRRLVVDPRVPHVIGVCATSGFSDEVRRARPEIPNVTLVLIEPDDAGGWRVASSSPGADERILKLFDPEGDRDKISRARATVEELSADLLTGSLSAEAVAERAKLPEPLVRRAFEELAAEDPELRISRKNGECLLFRGAPVRSKEKSMGVIDRIRQMFSGEGDDADKVNLLAERRAALAKRRDRMFEDIAKLEKKEAELVEQGKATAAMVTRRRLAAQVAQLRKDIARQNAAASMLNQQIDIISTDIHNLTLIQQGEAADLPDTQELTENAVRAEELLESLKADSELVSSLTTGMNESLTSDEELEILKEFEGGSAASSPPAAAPAAQRAPAPPQGQRQSGPVARSEGQAAREGEPTERSKGASPEAT